MKSAPHPEWCRLPEGHEGECECRDPGWIIVNDEWVCAACKRRVAEIFKPHGPADMKEAKS